VRSTLPGAGPGASVFENRSEALHDVRLAHHLAIAAATSNRTPGRDKVPGTAEEGYLHCGPSGAGHFVKMVHNGIEYGLMAAYARR